MKKILKLKSWQHWLKKKIIQLEDGSESGEAVGDNDYKFNFQLVENVGGSSN